MIRHRNSCIWAGVLFVMATAATMGSQMITAPMLESGDAVGAIAARPMLFTIGAGLEVVNALASSGIAIALFLILWRVARTAAVAYLGLRLLEGGVGLFAATVLFTMLSVSDIGMAQALHEWGFRLVLIVFSLSTFFLYPVLFIYRLVPAVLSVWGLLGGAMLLVSNLLIIAGIIETADLTDTVLSLPIWINEMALALWLIFRGVDLTHADAPLETGVGHA